MTSEVDPATQTAVGQLNSILATDSPLMQRARAQALQDMNQRGLINSSMAQGAGVAAMIDKATPLATADAATYAQRAEANQLALNNVGMFNVGEANKFSLQAAQQTYQSAQNDLDRAQQVALTDKSIKAQQDLQTAQQAFTASQNALQIAANRDLQTAQQTYQSAQNELDRAQQVVLADRSIQANRDLQVAQQSFTAAQSALDRAQQTAISQSQITANRENTQLQIDATAANLQTQAAANLQNLQTQIDANSTLAGKNYAASITTTAIADINKVQLDPNISSIRNINVNGVIKSAKDIAVDNILNATNAQIQWASTFYNTELPRLTLAAPGITTNNTNAVETSSSSDAGTGPFSGA